MSLATLEYPSRGVGPYPIHTLPYLDPAHLTFTVNDVLVAGTVDDANKLVTLTVAPAGGSTVRIIRTTPRDQDDRVTQFLDLTSGAAGLTGDLLDVDYRQLLYILGEARDAVEDIDPSAGMMLGDDGAWDARSLQVRSLTVGSNPGDLVTKSQLDAVDTSTTPLPTVTGADNDDGLFVSSAAWAKRTPAQARAHLGLGSAALLVAGTGASNAAQFDASARYPTADGRNIDITNHALPLLRARATVCRVTRTTIASNTLDPTVGTWSQNSSSRIGFNGTPWTNRIELNNSSDIDGSFSPGRVDLSAGTWRLSWFFKVRQTGAAGNNVGFRITDNDDTSGQTIHYDSLTARIIRQFNAGQSYYGLYRDHLILANASAFSIVFRWAMTSSGANNDADLGVFFHKVSNSAAS